MSIDHETISTANRTLYVRPLLEFLLTKGEKRFPRLNAFCDLMARESTASTIVRLNKQSVPLSAGQFVSTISTLAKDWQWQRSTVRTFLNSLVALGYLKMTPCGKHCIFTMRI
jgi:hypothetical protein